LNLAKITIVKSSVKIVVINYAMLWQHTTEILTILTLARFKYKLSDDGHRPKHVGAF